MKDTITAKVYEKFAAEHKEDWDIDGLNEYLEDFYVYEEDDEKAYLKDTKEGYAERVYNALVSQYNKKEEEIGSGLLRNLEKYILLEVVDNKWREHLKALDGLRESIYLRAYGQRDPVTEYKIILFKVAVKTEEERQSVEDFEEEDVKKVGNSEELCSCGSGKPYNKCCGR